MSKLPFDSWPSAKFSGLSCYSIQWSCWKTFRSSHSHSAGNADCRFCSIYIKDLE